MARKQTYTPPKNADLTLEQMESALPRLEIRIGDLRDFDSKEVTKRDDPKINALENLIDDFLIKTFGEGTVEYKRYRSAAHLNTASIFIGRTTPLHEVIQGLEHGKERAIVILEGIKKLFLEEIHLESVRRLYVGLQSFRSMSRMDASLMKASALRLRFSQSLASRRQRLSQAMVRSTTQRLGWTTKPFTRSDRLTISVSRSGRMPARAR